MAEIRPLMLLRRAIRKDPAPTFSFQKAIRRRLHRQSAHTQGELTMFQPGNSGGRPKGARNKLTTRFLQALAADFEEGGATAIKIARIEDPVRYVAIIASLMPKELAIEHNQLGDLSDEELNALLSHVREMRAKLIEQEPVLIEANDKSAD